MPPRRNQIFSHQQNIWIVTDYGEFKSATALRKGIPQALQIVTTSVSFSKVINKFMASGDVSLSKLPGPREPKLSK